MTRKEKMKKLVTIEKYLEQIQRESNAGKEYFSIIFHHLTILKDSLFVGVEELEEKELIEIYNKTEKELEREIEKIK